MKKTITIFAVIFSCTLWAQPDTCHYLKTNAEWYYRAWDNSPYGAIASIEIIRETLIDNRLCSVIVMKDNDQPLPESELILFYDKPMEKVYFYEDGLFKIIFDFSPDIAVGDTLEYYLPQNFGYYDISSSGGSFQPGQELYRYYVLDISTIELPDGSELVKKIVNPVADSSDECFYFETIVDGIGSLFGFMGGGCLQLPAGFGPDFRCFYSNDFIYSTGEGKCDATATLDLKDINVEIYPNPAGQNLTIHTTHPFVKASLFNLSGDLIFSTPFTNNLDIGVLPHGVYFVLLTNSKGKYLAKKIIIH